MKKKYDFLLKSILTLEIISKKLNFFGEKDQSFSARNWDLKRRKRFNAVFLIDFLFSWIDDDHCLYSWIYWKFKKDLRFFQKDYTFVEEVQLLKEYYKHLN